MLPLKLTGFIFFQCLLQGEHIKGGSFGVRAVFFGSSRKVMERTKERMKKLSVKNLFFAAKKPGAGRALGIQVQLRGILSGQLAQAICILFTVKLFLHRQCYHTNQSSQQNPHHPCSLLTILFNAVQEILQTFPFNPYYMHLEGKFKHTMQEILKKSFAFRPAFLPGRRPFDEESCNLKGRGLQVAIEMANMVYKDAQG